MVDPVAVGPLGHVKVIELCQNVAGPYAGAVLAALGADVVKVERPGTGDDTRSWGPPFIDDRSVMFEVMNAGKTSVGLDLDDAQARNRLRELIATADVVLQSWRPGSLERFGFGYRDLEKDNPQLIYCAISAFGPRGPLAEAPGYDPLLQAFAGIMSITGHPGSPPVRVGTSMIDMGTGMWAVIAVLSALERRRSTGEGCLLSASLLETGLAWIPYQMAGFLATGDVPEKRGSGLAMLCPYEAFPTQDRHIVIAAGNDRLWRALCAALDRGDLAEDPDLATNPQRVRSRSRVVAQLSETLQSQPAAFWLARLREAGVPSTLIQTIDEVVAHPQVEALDMIRLDETPPRMGLPFEVDGSRPMADRPAPQLPDPQVSDL